MQSGVVRRSDSPRRSASRNPGGVIAVAVEDDALVIAEIVAAYELVKRGVEVLRSFQLVGVADAGRRRRRC